MDARRVLLIGALLIGLAVRVGTAQFSGTQDMEWWSAYTTHLADQPLTGIYEQWIRYDVSGYGRVDFRMVQPPLYVYPLWLVARGYTALGGDLSDLPSLHAAINLISLLASVLTAWAIYAFTASIASRRAATIAALVYWLNPAVLLNSPIQGYIDAPMALFGLLSIMAAYKRHHLAAGVALACCVLCKPTGILIAPIVAAALFVDGGWRTLTRGVLAGIVAGVTVCLPFILAGKFGSVIDGVTSIVRISGDGLSGQWLGPWWLVTLAMNTDRAWFAGVPAHEFSAAIGFNVTAAALLAVAIFTAFNLFAFARAYRTDRLAIFRFAAVQLLGYGMLSVGFHVNHAFIVLPILAAVAWRSRDALAVCLIVSAFDFAQAFLFYGWGRDYTIPAWVEGMPVAWISAAIAVMFTLFVVMLCRDTWRAACR